MAHRWTAAYVFKWTPILTFARRRLQLLEWFEEHTQPVAFTEDADRVGVALVESGLRIVITRDSMVLRTAIAEGSVASLQPAVEGVFEVLDPRDVVIDLLTTTWTAALDDGDYHEERARFAATWTGAGLDALVGSFRPIDASVLADLESQEWAAQVEWGVVERKELLMRLTEPRIGRLTDDHAPRARFVDEEELPRVALFSSIVARRRVGGQVKDAEAVIAATGDADGEAESIATALFEAFAGSRGDGR